MTTQRINVDTIQKDGVHSVYMQVAQSLRRLLKLGQLANNKGELPTYRKLAEDFGVSVCVIQKAMRVLRNESLVTTYHGKVGRFQNASKPKAKTMLRLAMIHPFTTGISLYASYLQHCMDRLGWEAMITIQESHNDPMLERQIAEKLIYNNFDAILLSPEDTFSNAKFFEQLAKTVPVMLLDQAIPGVRLPATIVDYAGAGRNIGQELKRRNCHRVVALINDHSNTSVNDILESMAKFLPVTRFEFPLFKSEDLRRDYDYGDWNKTVARLKKLLEDNPDIDVVFSPFDTMIDQMYITEIPEELRRRRYTVAVRDEMILMHSQEYVNCNLLEWRYSRCDDQIFTALKRLVKWRETRVRPTGVKSIKMTLKRKCRRIPENE